MNFGPYIEYMDLKQLDEFEDELRGTGVTLGLAVLNREALATVENHPWVGRLATNACFST